MDFCLENVCLYNFHAKGNEPPPVQSRGKTKTHIICQEQEPTCVT